MSNSDQESRGMEVATAAICCVAAATGGLLGVMSGVSRDRSVVGNIVAALMQGAGGALILGLAALLVVAIGCALWVLVSAGARRLFRHKPSSL